MGEYFDADATELARLVRAGEVSAAELVDTAIAAVERVNPKLNAVVHPMFDLARSAARGPLPFRRHQQASPAARARHRADRL